MNHVEKQIKKERPDFKDFRSRYSARFFFVKRLIGNRRGWANRDLFGIDCVQKRYLSCLILQVICYFPFIIQTRITDVRAAVK